MYKSSCLPEAETVLHDHLEDRVEDVYAVVRGSGWVIVDSEEVPVEPGQFIAVTVGGLRTPERPSVFGLRGGEGVEQIVQGFA